MTQRTFAKREIIAGAMTPIGTFDMWHDLHVADPCYKDRHAKYVSTLDARHGLWHAFVQWVDTRALGVREKFLLAFHEEFLTGVGVGIEGGAWTFENDVGVDSGQLGFYDTEAFRCDADVLDYDWNETDESKRINVDCDWYTMNCDVTLGRNAGVIRGGCVSRSGFGDGGYPLHVVRDSFGDAIAARVQFIEDED